MKHNKIILLMVVCLVVCSVFSLSVFAADDTASTDGDVSTQSVTSPTTNIYYIINGMWSYFLPQDVISDNAGVIAFYNIGLTTLFALAPFIMIYKVLFRKK